MSLDQVVDDRIALALDQLRRNPPPPRLALTLAEAGQAIGVSDKTVDRWVKRGLLPTVPHTTRVLVPVVALEQFVSAGAVAPAGTPRSAGASGPADSTAATSPRGSGTDVVPLRPERVGGPHPTAGGADTPPAA